MTRQYEIPEKDIRPQGGYSESIQATTRSLRQRASPWTVICCSQSDGSEVSDPRLFFGQTTGQITPDRYADKVSEARVPFASRPRDDLSSISDIVGAVIAGL